MQNVSLTSRLKRWLHQLPPDYDVQIESSMLKLRFPWHVGKTENGWTQICDPYHKAILTLHSEDRVAAERIVTALNTDAEHLRRIGQERFYHG